MQINLVPIIPHYLWKLEHPDEYPLRFQNDTEDTPFEYFYPITSLRTKLLKSLIDQILKTNNSQSQGNGSNPQTLLGPRILAVYFSRILKDREKLILLEKEINAESESFEVGSMFASKSFFEFITNLFIGPVTNRYFKYFR